MATYTQKSKSSSVSTAGRDMLPHVRAAAALLRALANEQRLLVLCHLLGEDLSVRELQARLPLSQSALSQHLAVLRESQLVTTRRDAQSIIYSLASGPAARVIGTLRRIYCP